MSTIKLFPTLIYGKILEDITEEEISRYKEYCTNLNFKDNDSNGEFSKNNQVLNNTLFKNLKNQILLSTKKLALQYYQKVEKLQLASSWVNIINQNESISPHEHLNSYFSAVFYFSHSSDIIFNSPLLRKWHFLAERKKFKQTPNNIFDNPYFFKIKPEPKLLLIFPSWLNHHVEESKENNRITIAANIIPKGEFGPYTAKINLK